ncbi:MAG TPA: HPr kinase/phosphatase C-terminal domain-containing protein [Dongiaceae bacterium]|jgi:serine kinase of HPr protein (carbohydrate metabolism regulator)|nr:HPr kinase/phosphatase C-terminal domain-containing protein [Dongiaceae bacterium]
MSGAQESGSREGAGRVAIEGTAVALDGRALLLTGRSGSGKSDLALRLIDAGARLIADDRVELVLRDGRLECRAPHDMPPALKGRIEARGVGIVPVPVAEGPVPLQWCVELVPGGPVERLPAAESRRFLGIDVPLLRLDPFEASAAAKLRLAAACGPGLIMGRE